MNAQMVLTIVIMMLLVPIQKDPSTVLATTDILEMVHHVMVSNVLFLICAPWFKIY